MYIFHAKCVFSYLYGNMYICILIVLSSWVNMDFSPLIHVFEKLKFHILQVNFKISDSSGGTIELWPQGREC